MIPEGDSSTHYYWALAEQALVCFHHILYFPLVLLILSLVGPWRFPRKYLAYILFAAIVWIIPLFSPIMPPNGPFPYQSLTRYMLEVFPAFIVLAALGKYRIVHYTYLMIAGARFFFLLTQFLLGYMVV